MCSNSQFKNLFELVTDPEATYAKSTKLDVNDTNVNATVTVTVELLWEKFGHTTPRLVSKCIQNSDAFRGAVLWNKLAQLDETGLESVNIKSNTVKQLYF